MMINNIFSNKMVNVRFIPKTFSINFFIIQKFQCRRNVCKMIIKPTIEYFVLQSFNRNRYTPRDITCDVPIYKSFFNPIFNIFFYIFLKMWRMSKIIKKRIREIFQFKEIMASGFFNRCLTTNRTVRSVDLFSVTSTFFT